MLVPPPQGLGHLHPASCPMWPHGQLPALPGSPSQLDPEPRGLSSFAARLTERLLRSGLVKPLGKVLPQHQAARGAEGTRQEPRAG